MFVQLSSLQMGFQTGVEYRRQYLAEHTNCLKQIE